MAIGSDTLVSRVHATLERVAARWTIDDNGLSRNGTFAQVVHITPFQAHWLDETAAGFKITECKFVQLLLGGYLGPGSSGDAPWCL